MSAHEPWCDRVCDCAANPEREDELRQTIADLLAAIVGFTDIVLPETQKIIAKAREHLQ